MQQQNTNNEPLVYPDELTISLFDVVNFIRTEWKTIGIAAILGATIGAGGSNFLTKYKSESVLINNGALTFISWRGFQQNLPLYAAQLIETKRVKEEEIEQYRQMSDAKWWQKNVVPTYSLTKADTKDLATISKDLQDTGGTTILNFVITAKGNSKELAERNVATTAHFIKQGSAYLTIKNLINDYESKVLSTDSDLQRKILDSQIELKFMRDRAKNLEALRSRFPANAVVGSQQVVDLKDSNAKFMPISTQIVAVNSDINNTTEMLQRMQDQLSQIKTLRNFVSESLPIVEGQTDGLALAESLLELEGKMRKNILPDDVNGIQTLNNIQATLVAIHTNFSKGLDINLTPMVTKDGPIKSIAIGFIVGGILAALFSLVRKGFTRLNMSQSKSNQ